MTQYHGMLKQRGKFMFGKEEFFGFDHEKVIKKLKATRFIGEIPMKDFADMPLAVYYSEKPSKKKGHKHYVGVYPHKGNVMLIGLDFAEFETGLRYIYGLTCKHCKDHIYSAYRHDYAECKCGKIAVDGGRDYFKVVGNPEDYLPTRFDFITGTVEELQPCLNY